jgi:hypothetical protein
MCGLRMQMVSERGCGDHRSREHGLGRQDRLRLLPAVPRVADLTRIRGFEAIRLPEPCKHFYPYHPGNP